MRLSTAGTGVSLIVLMLWDCGWITYIVIFIEPKISEWIDDYKLFVKTRIPFTLAPATSTVTMVTETPETTQIVTSMAVPTTTETSTAAGTTITICDYIQGMISVSYVLVWF